MKTDEEKAQMRRLIHWLVVTSMCLCTPGLADDPGLIAFDAKINGQPVRLAFDTGAEMALLFGRTAKRLGLEVQAPPADVQPEPGKVKVGRTEECRFEFASNAWSIRFAVADLPQFLKPGIDGLIGWGSIRENVIEIQHNPNKLLIRSELGIDPSQWACLPIHPKSNCVIMQVPKSDGAQAQVLIDTGSVSGVGLNLDRWQTSTRPEWPSTLSAVYVMGRGLLVIEETWAKDLVFEGLRLTEVPVSQGIAPAADIVEGGLDAMFGTHAVSCFSWVIDGTASKVYIRPNDLTRIPQNYSYNRLGAVFVPRDIRTSNALLAHVVESSPAYEAGIRPGDELLRINDIDATKWRTDPSVMPLSRFWQQPAGTTLNLVLIRDNQRLEVAVTLQEIFARSDYR